MSDRRDYRSGSVYQRTSDGRWVATIEAGWTETGARHRIVLTAKTETAVKRKRRDRVLAMERGEVGTSTRETVKAWSEKYLEMRVRDLSPKGYRAAASPVRKWIVPTIGHRRLDQLTPADVRAVHEAKRSHNLDPGDVHRVLMTMLRAAIRDGYQVPPSVLAVKPPKASKSDRTAMTVEEGVACLKVAATMDRGSRWLFTLIYGARMGECLGLTRDAVDLDAGSFGEAVIEWQLQALPYNVPRDRSSGFRLPDGYEVRHLVDSYHLVRPKSQRGWRVAPFLPLMRDGMKRALAVAPENPWGLVWPGPDGRPMNDKHDRAEWWALQKAAGVAHPSGRPYHVHECRNFAATMLLEADVDEHVVTALLGHSTVATSRRYMSVRRKPMLEGLTRVGDLLQLG